MINFLQKNGQLQQVMIQQVKDVDKLSAEWALKTDERIELYLVCAQALEQEQDHTGAFKVYYEAFTLLETQKVDSKKYKNHCENLIISAIKSPSVINFEEIMLLSVVQDLKKTLKGIIDLVELFIAKDMKQFSKNLAAQKALLDQHNISIELATQKKQFI